MWGGMAQNEMGGLEHSAATLLPGKTSGLNGHQRSLWKSARVWKAEHWKSWGSLAEARRGSQAERGIDILQEPEDPLGLFQNTDVPQHLASAFLCHTISGHFPAASVFSPPSPTYWAPGPALPPRETIAQPFWVRIRVRHNLVQMSPLTLSKCVGKSNPFPEPQFSPLL